jgi:hypothetical protein
VASAAATTAGSAAPHRLSLRHVLRLLHVCLLQLLGLLLMSLFLLL